MGKIILLPETTVNPISLIGCRAGHCCGANMYDSEANYKRGLECIESGHGRALEYVNIEMVIEGYSARVIREWYTHISGDPTRLQASTRYIDYRSFSYITPKSVLKNPEAAEKYRQAMAVIQQSCKTLSDLGIPREDIGYLLPLGMTTVIVDKRNVRNLIDMSRQRMCNRALWEYRDLMNDICEALRNYSEEWAYLVETQMMPKCMSLGHCPEKHSCGMFPRHD